MIPLYSVDQVRSADKYAIEKLNIPGLVLMENAARSIADAIIEKYPYIDSSYEFGIICGKGNNGGDGFALARHLLTLGFKVIVVSLANERSLKGDALSNYNILKVFIKEYDGSKLINFKSVRDLNYINNCDIIVDALLGTGSSGELKEPYGSIVKKLNGIGSLKIAVDSPTGLNLENSSGDNVFWSDLTVTLAELKTGLFYQEGYNSAGKVVKGSIGMGNKYFESLDKIDFLVEPEDCLSFLPQKNKNIHKYSAGKVFTIAGSSELPGAAIFTMNAAMMSGAGSGILAFPSSIKTLAQSEMNSAVVLNYEDHSKGYLTDKNISEISEKIKWSDCIALGPGLGRTDETRSAIINILERYGNKNFVIDADAIFALGDKVYKKLDLKNKILTPHHGEFANLLNIEIEHLKNNTLKIGREFTAETGAYLVLKGAPTITFNPSGEIFINSSGNAGLAKFGSGDVLTGIIASFVAQKMDIEESVLAAVYLHGLSADLIMRRETEYSIIPQKLIDEIPGSIKFLRKSIV